MQKHFCDWCEKEIKDIYKLRYYKEVEVTVYDISYNDICSSCFQKLQDLIQSVKK